MIDKSKIYLIDIDGIIFENSDGPGYDNVKPIQKNIDKINQLYDDGNIIIIWTSRGSLTHKDWREVTKNQLSEYGVKYHDLRLDKPYFDMFIDDRARKNLDEIE